MGLTKVADNVYVLIGRTNVGVVVLDHGECIVIDTGIDRDSGRKVLNVLKETNLRVGAVVNTHSHADHIGGNRIVFERTNAEVYAPNLERPFIEMPALEVLYLYGAYPPEVVRTHLVEAAGVPVRELSILVKEVSTLKVEELPGHSLGMVGFGVEDVFFSADSFFPTEILAKYKIPYHLHVQDAYKTLKKLIGEILKNYRTVVPSHGSILTVDQAIELIRTNADTVMSVRESVLRNLKSNVALEDLVKYVLRDLSQTLQTPINYLLNRSAIMSYVSWLLNDGLVEMRIIENKPVLISLIEAKNRR
ncbi:MAG: MBL fold metallo-hydrolase [Zestosphaera sp.]